jgi:hypothetical protein
MNTKSDVSYCHFTGSRLFFPIFGQTDYKIVWKHSPMAVQTKRAIFKDLRHESSWHCVSCPMNTKTDVSYCHFTRSHRFFPIFGQTYYEIVWKHSLMAEQTKRAILKDLRHESASHCVSRPMNTKTDVSYCHFTRSHRFFPIFSQTD